MNQSTIREYTSNDQIRVKQFYMSMENKRKKSRVLQALAERKSVRQSWQVGIVSMVGIHLTLKQVTWSIAILELIVWTTSIGIFWYKWISQEYDSQLKKKSEDMIEILSNLNKEEKSNAWIMESEDGKMVGAVLLKYEDKREGKIGYLTGLSSEIRNRLVRNAIGFAKSNKIEVISKWSSTWSDNDHCL